jgi:class 3 adenylate cyclase
VNGRPETAYAVTEDGLSIGYQVYGSGPVDLVVNHGLVSNVDAVWDLAPRAEWHRALGRYARVVIFDRRGVGVSDRPTSTEELSLEKGMDDLRTVMDAAGSERAIILGWEAGAAVGVLFAASYPARVLGLLLASPTVYHPATPEHPWGDTEEDLREWQERIRATWGTVEFWRWNMAGTALETGSDEEFQARARWSRLAASPGAALAITEAEGEVDVRGVLAHVHVPTLVAPRAGEEEWWRQEGEWVAAQIPGARYHVLPGDHHFPEGKDPVFLETLSRFIAEVRDEEAELDRVLATVLFTDIVDSTATASVMGDARWRDLLEEHHRLARGIVARYRGEYVESTGDGMLATFDGPARAVRCAKALEEAVAPLGIQIRAGAHTGEITRTEHGVAGVGVHVAARVASLAGADEVWVSSTVKDLTAGSGLAFEDAGEHELKGVPDTWHLYRVVA